nr:MAG TPA: co-chaperonin [Caudoviricetes sp.]
MKVVVPYNKVLIKLEKKDNKTESGFIITTKTEKNNRGVVVETNQGRDQEGFFDPLVKVGDTVVLTDYAQPQLYNKEEQLWVINWSDIALIERSE